MEWTPYKGNIDELIQSFKHRDKVLPVGKYKGRFYEDVDTDYLLWFVYTIRIEPELERNITIYLIDNYKFTFGKFIHLTISDILLKDGGENYLKWVHEKTRNQQLAMLIKEALGL